MAKSARIYCAVYGCLNSSITHPELSFFKLPAISERRLLWLQLICRDDLKNKPNHFSYRICEKHFNVEDVHHAPNRRLLKRNALPLLMLPNLKSSNSSLKEDKETQTPMSFEIEKFRTGNAENENYIEKIPVENIKKESTDKDSRSSLNAAPSGAEDPLREVANSPCMQTVKMDECSDDEKDISLKQTIRDIATQLSALKDNDSFDAFGRYVASVMRSLPVHRAMAVQPKIVDLLVHAVDGSDDAPQC